MDILRQLGEASRTEVQWDLRLAMKHTADELNHAIRDLRGDVTEAKLARVNGLVARAANYLSRHTVTPPPTSTSSAGNGDALLQMAA